MTSRVEGAGRTGTGPRPWLDWLAGSALPLWTGAGWDRASETFVERLDLAGRPLVDAPPRVMVQGRQIYVMCVAHRRCWMRGADRIAAAATRSMIRRYHAVDGRPGWVFSATRDGTVVDATRDLYGHAFVLLALANAAATLAEPVFLDLADETLDFLDGHMASPAGGYTEAWPSVVRPRRQNPHMHLFEALLALHEASPERGYLARAASLLDLAEACFFLGRNPVLVEFFFFFFVTGYTVIYTFEPGHHFEWVWLLDRFSRLGGRTTERLAAALLQVALDHGLGPFGLVLDEVSESGTAISAATRLWPQTEAAKAMGTGVARSMSAPATDHFLNGLTERFLVPAVAGSWIDQLDEAGVARSLFAPASSLYHIVCALDDVSRS